ncbi:multimerin-2-like [Saccostrea cucullata]|uniref:multimerin-2-like n=1 Tax=Saccostrea cuccullata TaxID=36930 RepID=UPI002ED17431
MERILTFEIEQTIRIREQEMMKNISATVTDLELRDRYLTLSVLDVLRNMTLIDNTLSKLMQQQKKNEEQQNSTLQHLSLSVFDVHRNMTSLSYILSKFKQQQNTNEEQQNMIIQNLSLSLLDVHNNTAELSSSLSSLDAQQKQMKSEIQTVTNSQQNDITKLNDTIIHLKNHVQSKVAFTAGILREYGGHAYTGTVQFPTVIYQVGGGYHPTTGIFTAPKAGLYLIFCTNVALNHETFWTKIMINGSFKAGVMAYVGSSSMLVYQSGSNLVVHQLQVGDRVWIEVRSGSHLYSDVSETLFSVIMINGSD